MPILPWKASCQTPAILTIGSLDPSLVHPTVQGGPHASDLPVRQCYHAQHASKPYRIALPKDHLRPSCCRRRELCPTILAGLSNCSAPNPESQRHLVLK